MRGRRLRCLGCRLRARCLDVGSRLSHPCGGRALDGECHASGTGRGRLGLRRKRHHRLLALRRDFGQFRPHRAQLSLRGREGGLARTGGLCPHSGLVVGASAQGVQLSGGITQPAVGPAVRCLGLFDALSQALRLGGGGGGGVGGLRPHLLELHESLTLGVEGLGELLLELRRGGA